MAIQHHVLTVDLTTVEGRSPERTEVEVSLVDRRLIYPLGSGPETLLPAAQRKFTDADGVATFDLLPSSRVGKYRVVLSTSAGTYEREIEMPAADARLSELGDPQGSYMLSTMGNLVDDLSAEELAIVHRKLRIGDTPGDGSGYILPEASETRLGGVRRITEQESSDAAGTTFGAWSATLITRLLAAWRPLVAVDEAQAGTSLIARFWSALRVRQAADEAVVAGVPAVFRTGSAAPIPDSKIPATVTRDTQIADLLTGISVNGGVLEATRENGQNPLEVTLPIGYGLARFGDPWSPAADNAGNFLDTGIALPASPRDADVYLLAASWSTYSPVIKPLLGNVIKSLPVAEVGDSTGGTTVADEGVGGTTLLAAKTAAGNLLLRNDDGEWAATNFAMLWELTDAAAPTPNSPTQDGYIFYVRPALTTPDDITTPQSVTDAGLSFVLLHERSIPGRIYPDIDFSTEWFGSLAINGNWSGGGTGAIRNLAIDLTTVHAFNGKSIRHIRRAIIPWTKNTDTAFRLHGLDSVSSVRIGPYRPPDGNSDGSDDVEITEADLLGPVEIGYILTLRGVDGSGNYDPFTLNSLTWHSIQTRSYQIAHGVAVPVQAQPYITEFDLRGDLTPAAGDIGGDEFAYSVSAAHSDQIAAARLVGFAGTAPGQAVTVLKTFAAAEYHAAAGSITLPGTINLAAGESYTVRYEVYGAGQTVADDPVTHQDRRVTAQAAMVRYIRVPSRIGGARPTAANLIANSVVIQTGATVIRSWMTSGVPDDNMEYLLGWIVPQSLAQINHITLGGINNDHALAARFALTDNSVDYFVYLLTDAAAVDENANGVTVVVT